MLVASALCRRLEANSSRTLPSRPRASRSSRASACGLAIIEGDGSPRQQPQRPVELCGEPLQPSPALLRRGGSRGNAIMPSC
jgi:hypothetical protein